MNVTMRPSRDNILMQSADLWSLRSTCSRAQVGVVIATSDYRPLVSGYNGAPSGMPHCNHDCDCVREESRRRNIIQLNSMEPELWIDPGHAASCPSQQPCIISVHAEANAVAYAARNGVATDHTQLFTTLSPCYICCQLIINAGIWRVVYDKVHRDTRGMEMLAQAGVEVIKYTHET